ncbi:hypothetical protein [Rariglobus hedericola]|uniref:Uncharacterized protein n=1 Tax=Rariglobus hedericola TaxID=2597822 RepID=A0A556QJL1_9BACT|nr:hypothetical protein [Rariglobus hedericola]TSJ76818.1 hypothetical protein FPL22_11905 [Rariglobus hedericola]
MTIKKALSIGTLALIVAAVCFFRFGSKSNVTHYGAWFPTKNILLDTVTVKVGDDTRHISHIGSGADVLVASITSENIETAPTLYLPIFQFGEAKGTAQISLSLNGHFEGTMEVSVENQYQMFGLIPSLLIRSDIRSEINQAIVKTTDRRIKEFSKVERVRQTLKKERPE